MRWFIIPVNPEPWAVGNIGVGRRGDKLTAYMGQNNQLASYKEAIREELETLWPHPPIEGKVALRLFFWRRQDVYERAKGGKHMKHEVDATNLQKSTEDALQGMVLGNDRDVQFVSSFLVEQGPEVEGRILVGVGPFDKSMTAVMSDVPMEIFGKALTFDLQSAAQRSDNSWPPRA